MKMTERQIQKVLEENKHLKAENQQLKGLLKHHHIPFNDIKTNRLSADQRERQLRKRVSIFRSLFRGREDVYAVHWEYADGAAGYSPSRSPRTRVLNQLTDQVIYDHLSGKRTIGIYPLLKDETCFFLAVDFDKEKWQEDTKVFFDVCKEYRVPASMERSRSGNGSHVWIFFQEAVPARLARKLGDFLLSRALERRYQAGMDSYDRLFPNQDKLPSGGFGNLIALPLQKEPRSNGNSVFVDESLHPYPDQWHYLSQVKKMSKMDVQNLAAKHASQDRQHVVIHEKRSHEKMPTKVNIVLKSGIYIDKSELPTSFVHQIIKLATFNNPAFFKAQAKRLSTYKIPRVINCTDEQDDFLILPRGCMASLQKLFEEYNVQLTVSDKRQAGTEIEVDFHGKLSALQEDAVQHLHPCENGILSATTGFGKTVAAASLIARRKINTLVIVHRTQLLEQWKGQLAAFLNIDEKKIGQVGDGKTKPKGMIDIAMIQSLNRGEATKDILKNYGQVIVDECHHISAVSFEKVLKQAEAKYVHGLTATPTRKDGMHPITTMQCGSISYKIKAKDQAKVRPFRHELIPRYTVFKGKTGEEQKSIHTLYEELIYDEKRNEMIFNDVLKELDNGASPIILTERVEHVKKLASMFEHFAKNLIVLTGEMKKSEQKNRINALKSIPNEQEQLIIATGKYIGEGFDNARLDTMFLAMPIAWKGVLKQYVGRLHRLHEEKEVVKVYDYVDSRETMLQNMFKKRQRGYKSLGYTVKEFGSSSAEGGEQMKLF